MSCLKYHTIIFAFFRVFKHCKKEFSDWDCQKMVLGPWSFKYFVNRWCLEGCYFLNVVLCAGFSVLHFIILFYSLTSPHLPYLLLHNTTELPRWNIWPNYSRQSLWKHQDDPRPNIIKSLLSLESNAHPPASQDIGGQILYCWRCLVTRGWLELRVSG